MKLLITLCCLCLLLFVQPVENHFFTWLKNKVEDKFSLNKPKRTFDCGKTDRKPNIPTKSDTPRITGGISAVDHSFPWVVNVINVKSLKSCGGTIVGPNTIVTAAHCIIDEPKYITVIAGAANLFGRLNAFNYFAVSHVIIHPNYVSCCDYDIAIIKLKKKLKRSEMINSICLPHEKDQELPDDTMAFIAGWGGKYLTGEMNSFGSFHLKQGLVYVKSQRYCKSIFGSLDEKDEICATNTQDNVDSREGDSGGPLMILNKTDDRWYLFGVTSHGVNAKTIQPGVYSSISTKLDFIKKYL